MPQTPKMDKQKSAPEKVAPRPQREATTGKSATSARSYKSMNFNTPPPSLPQREAWSPPKVRPDGLLDFSRGVPEKGETGLAAYAEKQRETYLRNAAELDRALEGKNLTPQLQAYKNMRAMVAKTTNVDEKMRIVGAWRNAAIKYDYDQLKAGPTNDKHRTLVQAINGGHAVCDELAQIALHALDTKDASYVFYRAYDVDMKTGDRTINGMGHATVIAPNGDGISMLNVMGNVTQSNDPAQRTANFIESASRVDKLPASSGGAFSDKDGTAYLPGYSFNKDGYTADPKTAPARIGAEQAPRQPTASVIHVVPGAHEKEPLYTKVIKPALDAAQTQASAPVTAQLKAGPASP